MILIVALLSCQPECPTCPECPAPPAPTLQIEPWEAELLRPEVEEARRGIQPLDEHGFGICTGQRGCDEFHGTDAGELGEGTYMVRAEIMVPSLGEGWKTRFDLSCETTNAKGRTSTQNYDKEYPVRHVGAKRGFKLEPLWRIRSPYPQGARTCTYKLTPIRPDGVEAEPWTGSYSTPAPAVEGEAPKDE